MNTTERVLESRMFTEFLEQSLSLILDREGEKIQTYFERETVKRMLTDSFVQGMIFAFSSYSNAVKNFSGR